MLNHEQLYKKIGVRKLSHFINPRVLVDEDFVFPRSSEVNYFKISNVAAAPSKDINIFKNAEKAVVITKFTYHQPMGNFVNNEKKVKSVISLQKKKNTSFKFMPPANKPIKVSDSKLVIYNYGNITALHQYRPNPLAEYHKWRNAFKSLMYNVVNTNSSNNRQTYISVELPSNIPNKALFAKYEDKVNPAMLKEFPTSKHLTLLEIWRFITPALLKDTMLYDLKRKMLPGVTLVLTYNDKITLLNLGTLINAVKEYDTKGYIQVTSAETLRKMFIVLLLKILKTSAVDFDNVDKADEKEDAFNIVDADTTPDNEIDVAATLDEEEDDKSVSEIDYDEVTDVIIENVDANDVIDTDLVEYNDIAELLKAEEKDTAVLHAQIKALNESGTISKKEMENAVTALQDQENAVSPFPGDTKLLKDMVNFDVETVSVTEAEIAIPDINIIEDKEVLKDPISAMDTNYINKIYKNDLVSTVYALQKSGIIINEYDVGVEDSVLGGTETHTFKIKPLTGKASTMVIKLPTLNEDGTFKVSGNDYKLRKQRTDKPIRKIKKDSVALTSYFGKSFVTKATYKKDDAGFWFRKQLMTVATDNSKIKNIVLMPVDLMDVNVPLAYSIVTRYVKMFTVGKAVFNFDYSNRHKLVKDEAKLKEVESKYKSIVVGTDVDDILIMDKNGVVSKIVKNKLIHLGTVYDILNIDTAGMPVEFALIKLFKKNIPVGVLLSYYLGFNGLLKILKAKHQIMARGKRYTLLPNEYQLVFKDNKIILDRNDKLASMILGGFSSIAKVLKTVEMVLLNKKVSFPVVFNGMELSTLYVNEIRLMEDMFVDPMTLSVLKIMKEPVTFKALLVRASELLLDDNYVDPNDASGLLIKGYERISGMMYTEIIKSLREYENKNVFSKAKLTIDPYSVWRTIGNDSTSMLVEDLNPVTTLKQAEDVTYLGAGGRSKESMSLDTRVVNSSEIGIMSEASKDSGDVGVSAYLSANPKLANNRGMVDGDSSNLNMSNIVSTSAMLAPVATEDDIKRLNFVSIQNSHTIAVDEMRVPAVRTGYEAVLPYRLGEKYCTMAKEDGVVNMVTKNYIKVTFKSGKSKKIKLGDWVTKEEAGVSYNHTVITDLVKGAKFKSGNTIAYDQAFFEPDIFDKTRVIYKTGTSIKVALMETTETHEDSCVISSETTKRLGTDVLKSKSFIVKAEDDVLELLAVGDKVEPATHLFTMGSGLNKDKDGKLDKTSLAILQNIKNKSPKAKLRGTIANIRIYYNCEIEDMSKSLKALVEVSNKEIALKEMKPGLTGKVSSAYSIKGKPLVTGDVELKITLRSHVGMGIGDKGVIGNQLKTTIGDIYDHDIRTQAGTDVEAIFSTTSIAARIVNSPSVIGTTSSVLDALRDKVVETYFK